MSSLNADPPSAEHLPLGFPDAPGSYALLSDSPDTNAAVIFVHGFWGDAVDTWQEFQRLVDGPLHGRHFARADLFFYAYPSVRHTLKVATEHFEHFVKRMLTESWEAAVDPRTGASFPVDAPNRPYELLVLVGHSLGGVIIRNTIARAANRLPTKPAAWPLVLGTPPKLFAPAHSGFRHDDVVSLAAGLSARFGERRFTPEVLTSTSGFIGLDGAFRLLATGLNERGLAIYRIDRGQVTVIDPAPKTFTKPAF